MRTCFAFAASILLCVSAAACSAVVSPDPSRLGPTSDAGATDARVSSPDTGPPMPCSSPGTVETVACGNCGQSDRFCSGAGVWEYGPCNDEGVCAPGTMGDESCGNCGTRAARCTTACTWEGTGTCTSEGECAPGTRSRQACGDGGTQEVLCDAACEFRPEGECVVDTCTMPGTTEMLACGNCGRQSRFCTAARVWEYTDCMGEGVCAPGATSMSACGMCGEQASRCTAMCTWEGSGACMDEGDCVAGATRVSGDACPAGQTRPERCASGCEWEGTGDCSRVTRVDVMLLLDVTGSHGSRVQRNAGAMQSRFVMPLLGLGDVNVGVSYYADFPTGGYGASGDRPFEAGIEPGASASAIDAELRSAPMRNGGDGPESGVEALSVLSGGPAPSSATPFTCTAGRVAGGCWRDGTERFVVVYTDATNHNGPRTDGGAGLFSAYMGISPAPATWPEVVTQMGAQGITLIVLMHRSDGSEAYAQSSAMLRSLGQTDADLIDGTTTDGTSLGTALDQAVARVRFHSGL